MRMWHAEYLQRVEEAELVAVAARRTAKAVAEKGIAV